jgi:hypothetical protein
MTAAKPVRMKPTKAWAVLWTVDNGIMSMGETMELCVYRTREDASRFLAGDERIIPVLITGITPRKSRRKAAP